MDDFHALRARFDEYIERWRGELGERFTCPCCGYPTLPESGRYEICPLCHWEDDGQDDPEADRVWGGPNGDYSLSEARRNFAEHLIQYRPGDLPGFNHKPGVLALKRQLMDVYERLASAATLEEHAALAWQETMVNELLFAADYASPVKMYILVKETIPPGFAMVAAAHAGLAGYLAFKDTPEVAAWLSGPFAKTVCAVSEQEFARAKTLSEHVVITESALDHQEVALAFKPRAAWPTAFRFYRLYR
ncbi:MAG TPA: CPCC family cysteine-rich protein [Herpetosiphonaceae bacterium]|nr:CPCC family cysteine-rich protein [Herpetosiphonaceae bacterium]